MENNNKITDELITKYINGNTTEEEDNLIHDYLAQNPDFANDLLDIATAIKHQRKQDETMANKGKEQAQETKRVRLILRRTFYAVAASIVLLIGIRFFVSKPSANDGIMQEQPAIAEANTETSNTSTEPYGGSEETASETPVVINTAPEEIVFADNQSPEVQPTGNISEPQVDQSLLADNANPEQQQETNIPSAGQNMPTQASMTIHKDNSDAPLMENAVFNTDIPEVCDPDSALILKWSCNAPQLVLEIRYGKGKLWEKTFGSSVNSVKLGSILLEEISNYSPQGFNWKMTAYYRDGTLTKEGLIRFTNDSN